MRPFPSLTGVIRFLIYYVNITAYLPTLFPSLTGVIRFLIMVMLKLSVKDLF